MGVYCVLSAEHAAKKPMRLEYGPHYIFLSLMIVFNESYYFLTKYLPLGVFISVKATPPVFKYILNF